MCSGVRNELARRVDLRAESFFGSGPWGTGKQRHLWSYFE